MFSSKTAKFVAIVVFFLAFFLFQGCSDNGHDLDLSGSWSLTKAVYQIGNGTETLGAAQGTLVFSKDGYTLTLDLTIGKDQFAMHFTKEESGDCDIQADYRDVGALSATSYWYGSIHFTPGSGSTWTADFICYDDPGGALEIFSIPASAGTIRLVWHRA